MKKILLNMILFIIVIALPISSLAEPLPWLSPWINLIQGEETSREGVIHLTISPDGLMPLMEASYDAMLKDQTFLGVNEEELDEYLSSMNAMLKSELNAVRIQLGALSALLDTLSLSYILDGDTKQFTIHDNQEPLCTFAVIERNGAEYLISDLAPSYALQMNDEAWNRMLSALDITYSFSMTYLDQPLKDEEADQVVSEFSTLLPALAEVNLFSSIIECSRADLEALAEKGLANREGNDIFYTGSYADCTTALRAENIQYPHPFDRITELFSSLSTAEENEAYISSAGLQFFQEEQSEDEADQIPFTYTYAIQGNNVTRSHSRTLEYMIHIDTKDPVTGSSTRVSTPSTWENVQRITLTPVSAELFVAHSPTATETLLIDAGEPDLIRIQLTNTQEDKTENLLLLLTRSEEGQALSIQIDTHSEYTAIPTIQLKGQWKNDILSDICLAFDTLNGDSTANFFTLSSESQIVSSHEQLLSMEGCTIVTPNRYGVFEDTGYQKELQQVGKTRLNMRALTKLPKDARPMLSALLAIIAGIGQ